MDERSLCYIINTSDYCRKTIDQMQTAVSEQLKETFSSRVDFSEEQSLFDQLASISLKYLLQKVESQLEPSFNMLPKENWADLEGVGDISDYVKDLQKVLESFAKLFINILYEDYYMSFLNKLTIAFSQRFQIAIFKCKKICEYGAQQLLLDCHEIKNTIQQLQQIKKNDGEKLPQSSAYTNHINKSMARVENLLKVISQPPSKVLQVYSTLMDQKDQGEFEKILNLQGVKKSEYPHLFEAFEKQESNKGMTTVKKLFERFT